VLIRELRYGSFRREFALPEGVSADSVDATYEQGLLEVRVRGVSKPIQPPQKVAVKRAGDQRTIEGNAAPSTHD
jgi:HSP20 family protein